MSLLIQIRKTYEEPPTRPLSEEERLRARVKYLEGELDKLEKLFISLVSAQGNILKVTEGVGAIVARRKKERESEK